MSSDLYRALRPAAAFALLLTLNPGPGRGASNDAGFVLWESDRSGEFRIWRQDLAGGPPRPISAEEPGRDHCCAKLSPNGSRLVYLSLPGGARRYGPQTGALHLVDADGGRDRVLVPAARHYGEHRAAVWWGEDELVFIDDRNATLELRLSTAATSELVPPAAGSEGWLLAPGGRIASGNTPTFSDFVPGVGVRPRASLGGCQPAFSDDGRFAVWSAGAGGPIDAFELATRRSWTILEKADRHLPAARGYLYFPALSNDGSLLAVGASGGEHDHFRADYDIFVLELDPETLLPTADALPVAPHPAVDRFPDVYRPARPSRPAPPTGSTAGRPAGPTTPAPASRPAPKAAELAQGRLFLWQRAEAENRAGPGSGSEILQPHALAWIDRHGALALGGGFFSAAAASAGRLSEGLPAKNQLTLSLLVTPSSLDENGAILALSDGPRARNFVLRQEGDRIILDLRTSDSAKEGTPVFVARLRSATPTHLLLTFTPGRLSAFLDGAATAQSSPEPIALPGDLFPWRPRALNFGAEAKSGERWRGTLSEISIWNRPLAGGEIAAEAARLRALVSARPEAPRTELEVRLRARSPVPSLDEISPYREALVLDEVEVVRRISGAAIASSRLRVARWAILDGQTLSPHATGELYRLVVEPFAAQPQLESFFLSDRLPPGEGLPLYFDLGATAASAAP